MFKILGADGKEYGPINVDQLKQWIGEGRANQETMAQREGDTGWKRMGDYAEFAGAFGAPGQIGASAPNIPVPLDPGGPARAKQMVNAPAICLMIFGVSQALFALLGLVAQLLGMGLGILGKAARGELPPEFRGLEGMMGPLPILSSLLALLSSLFVLYAALRMMKLRSHGLSIAGAIAAIVPCNCLCCILGVPFGIWSLVVLLKPEVKCHFS